MRQLFRPLVLIVLAIGGGIYLAVTSWVEYRLNPSYGRAPTARETTLLSLLRNAFTIVLGVIVFMLVLSEIGVNIGPLLASVGVLSLAFSFGAQKLVQDVVTGVFIQFENAMNTGDVVSAGGISGVVERLSIRSVSLRSLDGTLHIVPFSIRRQGLPSGQGEPFRFDSAGPSQEVPVHRFHGFEQCVIAVDDGMFVIVPRLLNHTINIHLSGRRPEGEIVRT